MDDFVARLLGKFETVQIAQIDVDSNLHRDIDPAHVDELMRSIRERGLINPITLYHPPKRERYLILAGRHRFYAMKALKQELVSARIYDYPLNPYELRVIELYENIHRKDLLPAQREQQVANLHRLMQQVKGPAVAGIGGHSVKDTARIIGKSVGSVTGSLKIAKLIEDFPELGLDKATSVAEIHRTAKRLASVITNQHIAGVITSGQNRLADSYVLGDFFSNAMQDESFALIECDPPYAIDLASIKKTTEVASIRANYNEIPTDEYASFMHRLCNECYRLASSNSWLILWFGIQHYQTCSDALKAAGFHHHPVPAIWKKGNSPGQTMAADSVLGSAWECFFWARKGSPKLHVPGHSNIFDYPTVPPKQKIHATERPVDLIVDILRAFGWSGMPVLVPFLGSGNTLLAAKQLGMPAVGFELTENYRNAFVARLQGDNK